MPTETATTTFDAAFDAAVAEHSKAGAPAVEPAPAAEAPATDKPSGDTPEATTETTPQQTEKAAGEGATAETETAISDKDWEEISKLPTEDQRKRMNQAFTQKTQALAAERKELQAVKMIVETLQRDPQGTLEALGKHYGVKFGAEQAPATQEKSIDAMVEKMRTALGPELDFLADKLAPVMQEMAKGLVEQEVKPVKEWQEKARKVQAERETEAILQKFTAKRPDWKQPEIQSKMDGLAKQISNQGMDEVEYLDMLYTIATKNRSEAEQTKTVIKKMQAAAANAEPSDNGVSPGKVSHSAPKFKGLNDAFDSAFEAAKKGIQWES